MTNNDCICHTKQNSIIYCLMYPGNCLIIVTFFSDFYFNHKRLDRCHKKKIKLYKYILGACDKATNRNNVL